MSEQELTGLDGSNPLGFFAALGMLRWLRGGLAPDARLSFRDGTWRAVLHDAPDLSKWASAVADDARTQVERTHLAFSYPRKDGTARDLKPPPELFRHWLTELRAQCDTEGLAFAMGYASELGRDASHGAVVKPTALHFTAGQQQFLVTVRELAGALTTDDILEALLGPWRYERPVKTLSWDATVSRSYALRASDPSKEKRLGNPGADWLAFQALPLFPVVSRGRLAQTHGVSGSWKFGRFTWPLWRVPATLDAASSLVLLREIEGWSARERRLRGVSAVFVSEIARSEQGGYGSFGPARFARPAGKTTSA
ncbi:MAG: hypothetical protein ABMA64_02460 [Myxococcota bacterium]